MTSLDLSLVLDVARRAAKAGAAVCWERRLSGKELQIHAKAAADFVTDVDFASQETILGIIRETFPEHRILAEEEGSDTLGNPSSPYRWIIDPLDGTKPYIHGKDSFGTIIALQENDETLLGVMNLPEKREEFWGTRGGGAFFNGTKITSLRNTRDLFDAIICTNTILDRKPTTMVTLEFPRCGSLQNYGCSAEEMGDILKGQNDAVVLNGPYLWDMVAGCLLVQESGGKAIWRLKQAGNPRSNALCVAATEPIFEQLKSLTYDTVA